MISTDSLSSLLQRTREQSLSLSAFHILTALSDGDPTSMSSLAIRLNVTTSAVTDIVDRLERKGLVTRTYSKQDRRIINITITEEGLKTYQLINA
jgi:DNA-binding MarR family transcriptional regulator